jgi:hypothetical protein
LFALFSATESADAWLAWIASFVPIRPVRHPRSRRREQRRSLGGRARRRDHLASTYAVIRIAARVYAGAVLRAAPPTLLKDMIGATRAAIR